MEEFNMRDAKFLWHQMGRIDGVIEILSRMPGGSPEVMAKILQRVRDDIDKFVNNKTK